MYISPITFNAADCHTEVGLGMMQMGAMDAVDVFAVPVPRAVARMCRNVYYGCNTTRLSASNHGALCRVCQKREDALEMLASDKRAASSRGTTLRQPPEQVAKRAWDGGSL